MKANLNRGWRWLAVSAAAGLAACSHLPSQSPPALQAAWVVLGEQGVAVARAITSDAACPALVQDGVAQTMQVRAAADTVAQRQTASSARDSKPAAFPVLTCEATLKPVTRNASIQGQALPLPKAEPRKIIVIGDTGCRLKASDNYFQPCNDSRQWAFRQMAQSAAGFQPDLVVHVGDYHYRENACPPGHVECAGSPWGYGWDTWQADFFAPAATLLQAAPWVVVRGNHESCVRAGQGWWRFLDPRPLQAGRDCNREQDDAVGDYSPPYAVPLGTAGQAQLIVFDSAKAPNRVLANSEAAYQTYRQQFQAVNQLAAQAGMTFFINHQPILGFGMEIKNGALKVYPGNSALQDVAYGVNGQRLLPPAVAATLAGHAHVMQALTFASGQPAQFVSGNGGSSLDVTIPEPLLAGTTPYAGANVEFFSNANAVGFMSMEKQAEGWLLQAWDLQGKLLTSCLLHDQRTACQRAN